MNQEQQPKQKNKLPIQELTTIALMAAVIAVMAQIAIPMPPVPFTLQTAVIPGLLLLLNRRAALICMVIYLLLGLVGLPVFSHGRAGIQILIGPSGGFLFGFFPAILIGKLLLGKAAKPQLWRTFIASTVATYTTFVFGTIQFAIVMGVTLQQAFMIAALPFLLGDALKIIVFTPLFWKVRQLLQQQLPRHFQP
jgi:biotin transport system substrate-specific component